MSKQSITQQTATASKRTSAPPWPAAQWLLVLLVTTLLLLVAMLSAPQAVAKGRYLETDAFLELAFHGSPYQASTYWLKPAQKSTLQAIFDRRAVGLRIRYWQSEQHGNNTTAWVFNEIGKELPITIGVVINGDMIDQLHVIEYRESRGGEVRHPFFTKQFLGASLTDKLRLTQSIDGITGATLSVRSMKKVARAALYLHRQLSADSDTAS